MSFLLVPELGKKSRTLLMGWVTKVEVMSMVKPQRRHGIVTVSPLLGELGTSEESSAFLCVTVHHTLLLAVPNEWCNRDVFA